MYSRTYPAGEVITALETYNSVKSLRKASYITGVSKSTIHRWWTNLRTVIRRKDKRKRRFKRRHKYPNLDDVIKHLFYQNKDLAFMHLKQIQYALNLSHGISPSLTSLYRVLKRCKISRRRFNIHHISPTNRIDRKTRFSDFKASIDLFLNDNIVCLDETSFCNVGNPFYGYFPKGRQPNTIKVSKRERVSLVMAVHSSLGIVHYDLVNKAFTKATFLVFLKDLIPKLPKNTKAILMDNVAFHRSKEVVGLLEQHDLTPLYIPPYSPRCNPIEEVFSLLKRAFRTKTTKNGMVDRIEEAIDIIKGYKALDHNYNHTRDYVRAECQTLGL